MASAVAICSFEIVRQLVDYYGVPLQAKLNSSIFNRHYTILFPFVEIHIYNVVGFARFT